MTLFYLYSGLRLNEVFGLRGDDIELQENGLIVRYKRKGGKTQRREVAQEEVRDALLGYLKKSRRLTVLHTNDPIWTRHDRAGKPGQPLTSRSYANNLKKYAEKAGMRRVNHESQATTRVYVETVAVKRDKHSGRIASRIRRRKPEVLML